MRHENIKKSELDKEFIDGFIDRKRKNIELVIDSAMNCYLRDEISESTDWEIIYGLSLLLKINLEQKVVLDSLLKNVHENRTLDPDETVKEYVDFLKYDFNGTYEFYKEHGGTEDRIATVHGYLFHFFHAYCVAVYEESPSEFLDDLLAFIQKMRFLLKENLQL